MKENRRDGFFIVQLAVFVIVVLSFSSSVSAAPSEPHKESLDFILGEANLGRWRSGISRAVAEAPGPGSSPFVLAEKRTKRPDILSGFKKYQGGWDIVNKHYWASVGYTGISGFILAVLWFMSFGIALGVHHCCGWTINIKGKQSHYSQRICLILLIVFTCAAAVGCILLSVGQDEFHVNVAQLYLPSDIKDDIDKLNVDLNNAAETLWEKTNENSIKIRIVFDAVRLALITVAAVMLLVSVLGLVLSVLGHRHAIYIFVVSGWLLVAATFILCGVFLILENAIADTCVAMGEWVDHPHAETALSNILPCVDQRTTNQTLIESKEVTNAIVDIVNEFVDNFANSNPPPQAYPIYYNQSGPLMPHLCHPYDSYLLDRQCPPQEVSMGNASEVWQNYICTSTGFGVCSSVGRLTPDMYERLVAAVNISNALQHYAPILLSLQDCNFVRDTFRYIVFDYCPPLEHQLQIVNAGLGLISVGVLLSLVLWMIYAYRPREEEVFAKGSFTKASVPSRTRAQTTAEA
ncbi:hypothetical protein POM88_027480 [Heracleum sosnowskyi]|uniref:Tetraspanin n=1 Tax=Heracleum sosnowskyi TaxID=360622 RepID=A0AAD8I814_9APIA|nr:hypothetical protein POM88_027480 [Heracleum sosnowskyi]